MTKLTDEQLQAMLEKKIDSGIGEKHIGSPDQASEIDAYRQLFLVLSTPPKEGLSMDFSARLRFSIQQKLQKKNRIRFYTTWSAIFLLATTGLFFGLLLLDMTYHTWITSVIADHKWIFIPLFPLIFLIQYLDYTVIREQQFKNLDIRDNS